MIIRIGDLTINQIVVLEEKEVFSRLTNEKLKYYTVKIEIEPETTDFFENYFGIIQEGEIIVEDSHGEGTFRSIIKARSFAIEGNPRQYTLEMVECEHLKISTVDIAGIVVEPYDVRHEVSDDAVVINMKSEVSLVDFERINALNFREGQDYFDVVRVGIDDVPLKMRFGHNVWSRDNDIIKMGIVLVEDVYDKGEEKFSSAFGEPELSMAIRYIKQLRAMNERLLDILEQKGIISKAQRLEIQEPLTVEERRKTHYLFREVRDLEEW